MKFLFIFIFILSATLAISAQNRFGKTNGISLKEMQYLSWAQFDENNSKYFWAINLNKFTETQKSAFQELVFDNSLLIACSTPDENNIWYLSSFKTNDINLVIVELEKLIYKAKTTNVILPDKYEWKK